MNHPRIGVELGVVGYIILTWVGCDMAKRGGHLRRPQGSIGRRCDDDIILPDACMGLSSN